ncbi:MAG: sulfatase-like hydrolase/transferase, partial [Bacteroidota bacterium]
MRQFKKVTLIFGIAISIAFSFASCQKEEADNSTEKSSPNLLVIQTDEHNFRTLGCYRDQLDHEQAWVWGEANNVETPNIDYLASNGMLFNKFYAATPVCSPSRASFISGLYPQHAGVPSNNKPMRDSVITA